MMKFIAIFAGGEPTKEEREAHMTKWNTWIKNLKKEKIEYVGGYPYGQLAKIVSSDGVKDYKPTTNDGSGYMLFRAKSVDDGTKVMLGAPSMVNGGKVIVRDLMDMEM